MPDLIFSKWKPFKNNHTQHWIGLWGRIFHLPIISISPPFPGTLKNIYNLNKSNMLTFKKLQLQYKSSYSTFKTCLFSPQNLSSLKHMLKCLSLINKYQTTSIKAQNTILAFLTLQKPQNNKTKQNKKKREVNLSFRIIITGVGINQLCLKNQ